MLLVENAKRNQQKPGSGQNHDDPVAATLLRAPAQSLEYTDRAEPAHHVVANGNNRRRFGIARRPFDTEHARYGRADLIEPGSVRPWPFVAMEDHLGVDQSGLLRA